jgi:Fic family protein
MIEPRIAELICENEKRKKAMNAIERIARFHLEFEGIHPFIDGNGRTGRLIMNLDLIRQGYPPINVKYADRRKYYDAFDAYYRDGDASVMIGLIAGYVNERLEEYLKILDM